jgi:hypothetical protein
MHNTFIEILQGYEDAVSKKGFDYGGIKKR